VEFKNIKIQNMFTFTITNLKTIPHSSGKWYTTVKTEIYDVFQKTVPLSLLKYFWLQSQMKKCSEAMQTLCAGCKAEPKIFAQMQTPFLGGGAGQPKFNQLETITTFT